MPRETALEALVAVENDGAYSNIALDRALRRRHLARRDKALATELVYGVLKQLPALDAAYSGFLRQPPERLDRWARAGLRLGGYQLLFLDRVPDHAAIGETVEAVKRRRRRLAGLINAVLRRVLDDRAARLASWRAPITDATGLGLRYGLPERLAASLLERLGVEEASAYGEAIQRPAPVTLRLRDPSQREAVRAALEALDIEVEPTRYAPGGLRLRGSGDPTALDVIRTGRAVVQDEGAQLVTLMAAVEPGMTVLDLCAGRGGKSFHLADELGGRGRLVAYDLSAAKLDLLDEQATRLGVRIETVRPEPNALERLAPFDCVLVDAPCSGTGVIRRHPERRWRLDWSKLPAAVEQQRQLIDQGLALLAPGGRLVYAVCSDLPAEGHQLIQALMAARTDLRRDGPAPLHPDVMDAEGDLVTQPHRHDSDGFYAARLGFAL